MIRDIQISIIHNRYCAESFAFLQLAQKTDNFNLTFVDYLCRSAWAQQNESICLDVFGKEMNQAHEYLNQDGYNFTNEDVIKFGYFVTVHSRPFCGIYTKLRCPKTWEEVTKKAKAFAKAYGNIRIINGS